MSSNTYHTPEDYTTTVVAGQRVWGLCACVGVSMCVSVGVSMCVSVGGSMCVSVRVRMRAYECACALKGITTRHYINFFCCIYMKYTIICNI